MESVCIVTLTFSLMAQGNMDWRCYSWKVLVMLYSIVKKCQEEI